jgi:hypothetical protein
MTPDTFVEFPKLARLSREAIVTEKIDGTNAQIFVWDEMHDPRPPEERDELHTSVGPPPAGIPFVWSDEGIHVAVGSRTRWLTPQDDHHGFARWALEHVEELVYLGHGRHFGEWWGSGIQRGYGLTKGEKRLSLFNVARWDEAFRDPAKHPVPRPACCHVVPVISHGIFTTELCLTALEQLRALGSVASPGFMKPEGIVCWHTAANMGFKKTLEKDDVPKSLAK